MTAGFVLSAKVWQFTDAYDDVGGATPTGTVVYENVSLRLQNSPNSLEMNVQGYETSKFFSAIVDDRRMVLFEKKHYLEITSPPNHRYFGKMFRITSIQESNFHPNDPRRYLVVNLERMDKTRGESYQ